MRFITILFALLAFPAAASAACPKVSVQHERVRVSKHNIVHYKAGAFVPYANVFVTVFILDNHGDVVAYEPTSLVENGSVNIEAYDQLPSSTRPGKTYTYEVRIGDGAKCGVTRRVRFKTR